MMERLVKDPLVQVLLAGLLIYGLYSIVQPAAVDDDLILVDEAALTSFIVKRTASADENAARARLHAMNQEELDLLIKDYVRERSLLAEALRLGLDNDDYVMERRLVQRLEFALLGFARSEVATSEETLRGYLDANRSAYEEPARITFTHVYLDAEKRAASLAEDAEAMLAELLAAQVDFSAATRYGDRFLYHRNYVDRSYDDIASHFGQDMAEALFSLGEQRQAPLPWRGPFRSAHGQHLVLVRDVRAAHTPTFDELRATLKRDYVREIERQSLAQAVQRIIDRQRVRIDFQADAHTNTRTQD